MSDEKQLNDAAAQVKKYVDPFNPRFGDESYLQAFKTYGNDGLNIEINNVDGKEK